MGRGDRDKGETKGPGNTRRGRKRARGRFRSREMGRALAHQVYMSLPEIWRRMHFHFRAMYRELSLGLYKARLLEEA